MSIIRRQQDTFRPYMFDSQIAIDFGLDCAIFYNKFCHLVEIEAYGRKAEEIKRKDPILIRMTFSEMQEYFPFWNELKLRQIVKKSIEKKLIIKVNKNNQMDKTGCYMLAE